MARRKRTSSIHDLGRPDITEVEIGKKTHRVAEVQPMDVDGVRTMAVGTTIWAVAIIAMLPFWTSLQDSGRDWWLWSAVAGFGLGLLGIEYCRRRRDALARRAAEQPIAAPDQAPAPAATTGVGRRRKN